MPELKMPEINVVSISGNLTKDPVYRKTANGTPVVNFTIASNRKYKDGSNRWQEDSCFVGVVAWNKLAESCHFRLKKGSAVLIDGELQSRLWKSDDNLTRSVVEIKARRIQFLNKFVRVSDNGYDEEEQDILTVEDTLDYSEDRFDKFSVQEDSELNNEFDEPTK